MSDTPTAPAGPDGGGTTGVVALLDIDDMAGLNRATDFDKGDLFLSQVEDVLRRALPEGLSFETLENGRFVIWLPDTTLERAAVLVENLRSLAGRSFIETANHNMSRPVSAGIAPTFSETGRGRALLHASSAVARAKALGGNRLELNLGGPEHPTPITTDSIREAAQTGALDYHVQPIIDLKTGEPRGVEALLRWDQGDDSPLGPARFIHRLERLPDLAEDVFMTLSERTARPFVTAPTPIFITFNISGAILDGIGSTGCRWLRNLLDRVPPEHLVVEVLEYAVMARPERTKDLLGRLSARGVRVALDDFGTGLSNLDRLKDLPVNFVKLDKVFLNGLGEGGPSEAIIRNMVRLCEDLDISMIAEGIESYAQQTILAELGVPLGQGFHLGRPAAAAEWQKRLLSAPES